MFNKCLHQLTEPLLVGSPRIDQPAPLKCIATLASARQIRSQAQISRQAVESSQTT